MAVLSRWWTDVHVRRALLKDTVLLVLLCQPRMGSSLIESLLGESPEVRILTGPHAHPPATLYRGPSLVCSQVLELQEMFNFFAHSPLQDEALRFFTAQLLGSAGAFPHPNNPDALAAYGDAVNRDEAATVRVAAQLAHAHGKRALTFKIFGQSDTMLRMFAGYSNNSVAILLERNVFTATVSALKIDSGCSDFQIRDSTRCRMKADFGLVQRNLIDTMSTACFHRAAVGAPPFAPLPIRLAHIRYEELEGKPPLVQLQLVQMRVRAASAGALRPYRSNGVTWRQYRQQDRNHSLTSSLENIEELRQWYTPQKRSSLCRAVVANCSNAANSHSATEQAMLDWCDRAMVLPTYMYNW